ncbi:hypothetical protein ACFXAW_02835 [Streptomyces sp. NPDC059445]|uniref:hypothetical protein n=1 Tax=Streptomyces sp. NPDC059445 TaxID=3346832 RepID=UPI00367CC43B
MEHQSAVAVALAMHMRGPPEDWSRCLLGTARPQDRDDDDQHPAVPGVLHRDRPGGGRGEDIWRCPDPECGRRTYGTGNDDALPSYIETGTEEPCSAPATSTWRRPPNSPRTTGRTRTTRSPRTS